MKDRIKKLFFRLNIAYRIIFRKDRSFVYMTITKEEMIKLFQHKDFYADCKYQGLRPYIVNRMFKMISNNLDADEMALQKAAFEAEAEIFKKGNP